MPSPGGKDRADGHAGTHRTTSALLRHAGTLVLCLLGGFALLGAVDVILRLAPMTFVVAGLVIGVTTWLPLTFHPGALPGEQGADSSP